MTSTGRDLQRLLRWDFAGAQHVRSTVDRRQGIELGSPRLGHTPTEDPLPDLVRVSRFPVGAERPVSRDRNLRLSAPGASAILSASTLNRDENHAIGRDI